MEVSTLLLVLTGLALVAGAIRLGRAPARAVADWWITFGGVVAIAATLTFLSPRSAGYAAFAALALLVLLPLRLDRAALHAARAGRDERALLLSRIAALLHPLGALRRRPASIAAVSLIRRTGAVDDATLEKLGARSDPELAEWYRLLSLHARADSAAIRGALILPSRRARMLSLGFGAAWVRAVADTGDRHQIVDAIEEAERRDATLDEPDRRAQLALEACAALGDVEGVRAAGAHLADRLPEGSITRALLAAKIARGEECAAEIDRALAGRLDPAMRRSIEALRARAGARPDSTRQPDVRAEEPRALSLLDRLKREALAGAALAPLGGGGGATAWATYAIAGAIVAWYAVIALTGDTGDAEHLARMGGLVLPLSGPSSALRLLTATLVHYGPLHLTFNLYALVVFGRFVESFYGKARLVAIWLAATIVSGLGVAAMAEPGSVHVLVGASGAIFGLGGALVAAVLFDPLLRRSRRGREELRSFAILVAIQLVFDRLVPKVSGTAHVAGLIGGFVAGALLRQATSRSSSAGASVGGGS